ncbi:MAG: hypothetical protein WCI75_19450, partial [candidate division NC10 bacterium]
NRQASAKDAERYKAERDSAERDLRDALSARKAVEERLGPVGEEARRLAWRIGEQEALEAQIRRLSQDIAGLQGELVRERRHLGELEDELARPSKPVIAQNPAAPSDAQNPNSPHQPSDPNAPLRPHLPLGWIYWAIAALAAAVAAWWVFRRRKQGFLPA